MNGFKIHIGSVHIFQDKLEFKGLIVNTGIRFDYSQSNAEWFELEQYDELLNSNNGFELEELATKKESKAIYKFSPRLAISHPITENSKVYFNYGHLMLCLNQDIDLQLIDWEREVLTN